MVHLAYICLLILHCYGAFIYTAALQDENVTPEAGLLCYCHIFSADCDSC